jgi:hypothetical protein
VGGAGHEGAPGRRAAGQREQAADDRAGWARPKKSPTIAGKSVEIVPYGNPNSRAVAYSDGSSWARVKAAKLTACRSIPRPIVGRRPIRSDTRPMTRRPSTAPAPSTLTAGRVAEVARQRHHVYERNEDRDPGGGERDALKKTPKEYWAPSAVSSTTKAAATTVHP